MKTITSMENPIIRRAIGLKDKKHRDKEKAYLIDGFHVCMEALEMGKEIEQVIVSDDLMDKNKELAGLLEAAGVWAVSVPSVLFKKIADVKTPAGMAAIIKKDILTEEDFFKGRGDNLSDGSLGNFLVLDRISDPGNAGTLIRTSEAAGFKGVIIMKGSVDVYSPKVVRAAAGSMLRQALFFIEAPKDLIELAKKYNKLLAVASPKGSIPYYRQGRKDNLALVIGNEGQGIREEIMEEADLLLEIPMSGRVESLNAAVAGGILMYWASGQMADEQKG